MAYGVKGGQQVGIAYDYATIPHAALWSGSANSLVNLHPSGWYGSAAYDLAGGQQVGVVYNYSNLSFAALWSGSASSFVNLHAFLGPQFIASVASGITHENGVTYVVGYGLDGSTQLLEAVMWVIPEPASLLGLGLALALFPRRR